MKNYYFITGLLLLFVLAGCSNGNDVSQEITENDDTITFGFLGPLTGNAQLADPTIKNAVALAVEEINTAGGINNKQVDVIFADGKCSEHATNLAIQELTNIHKVPAIIGGMCAIETLTAAPVAEATQTVLLSPATTHPNVKDLGDYIYRNVPSDEKQARAIAKNMNLLNYEKVAVLTADNEWGTTLEKLFREEMREHDIEVATSEFFEPSAANIQTQLTKIENFDAEVLLIISFPSDMITILNQMKELGLNVPVLTVGVAKDDSIIEQTGETAEGIVLHAVRINDVTVLQDFIDNYFEAYGTTPGVYAAEAYDAMHLLALACTDSDCTGRGMKQVIDGLRDYTGASGTFSFDVFGEVNKQHETLIVNNGRYTPYTIQ